MTHNFTVTYVDTRGCIQKAFVENQKDDKHAEAVVRKTGKVKELLSIHLAPDYG